jgi:hypothetical protein
MIRRMKFRCLAILQYIFCWDYSPLDYIYILKMSVLAFLVGETRGLLVDVESRN